MIRVSIMIRSGYSLKIKLKNDKISQNIFFYEKEESDYHEP